MSNVFTFTPYDSRPAPRFTITFTGTPKLDSAEPVEPSAYMAEDADDVPTFDVRDPTQREAFRDAILGGFDTAPANPVACTCGPEGACSACATDETDPGSRTSNVAVMIEVKACDDGSGYIAQCEQFSQYGMGDTPYEALRDYFAEMADFMDFLQRHEYVLGKTLTRELDYLRALAGVGRI